MDLSRPMSTVAPSLDGPVLEVLARTSRMLSGRQIQQLAGTGSEAGVRLVLARLVRTGLVSVHDAGNSQLYVLNRRHLAAESVIRLADLRRIFYETLAAEISGWPAPALHVSVFGSTARGDGEVDSDIDLLLVRPAELDELDPRWQQQTAELSEDVTELTGNHAQLYDIGIGDLVVHVDTDEPIVGEWRRDAVTLYGPEFGTLLRRFTSPEAAS